MNKTLFSLFFALLLSLEAAYLDEALRSSTPYVRRQKAPPKQSEIFFNVDLLIWDAREEGLEYAYKNTGSQTDQDLTSLEPGSKFEPAFRIGLGGYLPYDSWTLEALYTSYQTHRHSSGTFDFDTSLTLGPGNIAVWTYPSAFSNNNNGARFESASSAWKLHASFVDLALSRPCSIGASFTFIPSFGVRSAWLHQHYDTNYDEGNLILFDGGNQVTVLSSELDMLCNSNNVGLLFGAGFKWLLGNNLDLFTNLSGALLASHFDVNRVETDLFENLSSVLETQSVRLKSAYWSFRPQAQLALGVRYSYPFLSGSQLMCFRVSAAYEAQMWWKQNQLLRYLDVQNATSSGANVVPSQGDLMFHGVDIEAGFDF
jgi:hypothetical protein